MHISSLKKKSFWFLRHGQTNWNKKRLAQGRTDIPLNHIGQEQADKAGDLLSSEFSHKTLFNYIISSPLERAYETALRVQKIINKDHSLDIKLIKDDTLKEVSFGDNEGKELTDWYQDWIDKKFTPKNGENFDQLQKRAVDAVNKILESYDETVLIVAHGAIFRALRHNMGITDKKSLPNATPVFIEPKNNVWDIKPL